MPGRISLHAAKFLVAVQVLAIMRAIKVCFGSRLLIHS
jgi:hypothetical protein